MDREGGSDVPRDAPSGRRLLDADARANDLTFSGIFLVILALTVLYLVMAGFSAQLDSRIPRRTGDLALGGAFLSMMTAAVGMGLASMSSPRTRWLLPWPVLGTAIALATVVLVGPVL